jgi:putative copper export protein
MADIRVEQKKGGHAWIWIVLAVVLLIAAVLLLDRAGYINLPIGMSAVPELSGQRDLAAAEVTLKLEG